MSDYQGRQVDEQPHGHTPSSTNQSRKARGDCKHSINDISLRVTKRGNYNMQTCKKTEGNKLLLLLLLLNCKYFYTVFVNPHPSISTFLFLIPFYF